MRVRLLVERGQDVCVVKLAGKSYKFVRNEHGHLVSDISDAQTIAWVSDPRNSSFIPYNPPKTKATETVEDEVAMSEASPVDATTETSALNVAEVDVTEAQSSEMVEETNGAGDLPPYPKKGSKRPVRRGK